MGLVKTEHSYRIVTDLLVKGWEYVEPATRDLFEMVGVDYTPESSTSPWFFVPAIPTDS